MLTLREELGRLGANALKARFPDPAIPDAVAVDRSQKADFQSSAAMQLARALKRPPREIADALSAAFAEHPAIARAEIAGAGFVNLSLRDEWIAASVLACRTLRDAGRGAVAVIDYSSPNVAKPMHIGHIRSTILGEAIKRVMRATGYSVVADNHLGDWGTQFGMIIYGFKHFADRAAFAANPVQELARLYRLVHRLVSYRESLAERPKLEAKLTAREAEIATLSAAAPTGDKKADKKQADTLGKLRKQLAEARKPKTLVLPPARERRPAAVKDLPSAPEIAVRGAVPLPPQADLQLRPPVEAPKPAAAPPPPPVAVRPAATTPAVVTPKPVPAAPVFPTAAPVTSGSGRILWTGDLPKGATLQIDGRQASRGFVNSELPASSRIGAYPAELTNDGLKVYTGNPRYAQAPRVEPASAANGWQKTQYVYDPKALRDLIVEQMPGQQDPRKLVLRAGRRLSVIVIEWQVPTP
jgi:hypothetical protein